MVLEFGSGTVLARSVGEQDAKVEQVGLARPYICRLSILMRLTCPSTQP